jgi:transcriptional regulator with XRE-family HTH domain
MPWNPETLRRLRERRGLTQAALAEKAGTHPVSIAKYETGTRVPSVEQLEKLAKALKTTTDSLLRRTR